MSLFRSPEHRLDPFPFYARMRREQPVAWLEEQRAWGVFRHEDVRAVLGAPGVFSSEIQLPGPPRRNLAFMDPPRHTQLRALVTRAFTPQTVARLEDRIAALTHELLDRVAPSGQMEVIGDLAYPLPVIVIAEMLGIPPEDRPSFRRWSDAIVRSNNALVGPAEAGDLEAALAELTAYFAAIIARRRAAPEQDLVSALVAAEIDGERLSEADMMQFCRLLLVAGHETTMHLLGNAVLTLIDHPEVEARLRRSPDRIPAFVEEVLRYRSPVQILFRDVREDTRLGGHTLKAGQRVWTFLGSANRDEAVFAEPDRFDLDREPNHHLAFGVGIHFCLGAPLTRLEARVALRALLARFVDIARADDGPLRPGLALIMHGLAALPIRFRAA